MRMGARRGGPASSGRLAGRGTGRGRRKLQRTADGALSRHTGCGDTGQDSTLQDNTMQWGAGHCGGCGGERRSRGSGRR
jgi:hypothetical protein